MPVFHYIDWGCEPRRQLGDRLVPLAQKRVLALNLEREVGQAARDSPGDVVVRRRFSEPHSHGDDERYTLEELRAETAELDPFLPCCAGCPASLNGGPFGCIQTISFPIATEAEAWLLERIGPPDTLVGTFFRQSAAAMGYGQNCQRLIEWRANGYLQSPEPLARRNVESNDIVTSDMLLHAMLMSGDLDPARLLSLLLFTRALGTSDGGGPDEVLVLVSAIQAGKIENEVPEFVFQLEVDEGDPPSIQDTKAFLLAAFRAFSLQVPLAIRMTGQPEVS